jgi:hypothetical protein
MGEIVNLRRARKARDRAEKETIATANRARFGEAPAARDLRQARERQRAERLAAHLRKASDEVEER